jgi:hypothetical protein
LDFIKDEDDNEYEIFNHHNLKNYFIIDFDNNLSIRDIEKPTKYYTYIYDAGTGAKYFSEYGIVLTKDGTFIPTANLPMNVTSSSSVSIPTELPEDRVFVFNTPLTNTNIPLVRVRATNSTNT